MGKQTILQGFEWYLPNDGNHWKTLAEKAEELSSFGINAVWMPPAYKGSEGANDVGYGTYDLYDLGEFDQKGSVRTKYGTKEEYLSSITALKKAGLKIYAGHCFRSFMGADEMEVVSAVFLSI